MPTNRRSIFKSVLALPIVSWIGGAASRAESDDDAKAKRLAFDVLRFVNTAETWQKDKYGKYLPVRELMQSPVIQAIADDKRAEAARIGPSLISKLSINGPQIIPGWELQLKVCPAGNERKRDDYIVVIRSQKSEDGMVTSRSGLVSSIMNLPVDQATLFHEAFGDTIELPKPPVASNPSRFRTLARGILGALASFELTTVAFAQTQGCNWPNDQCVEACGTCCCNTTGGGAPMCCNSGTGSCIDMGCLGCVWCCTACQC